MDPTFPYAGNIRIPPKEFLLRSRIEGHTRDSVNRKQFEHWQTDVPGLTENIPNLNFIDNSNSSNSNSNTTDIIQKTVPIYTKNTVYNDMDPINTRTDARDYKQSQPYEAGGPDLAYNTYFDRYDPVSDPRNVVRELRSAVYEDKGTARGVYESQQMLRRNFENRWVSENVIDDQEMDTFLRYEIASVKTNQSNDT